LSWILLLFSEWLLCVCLASALFFIWFARKGKWWGVLGSAAVGTGAVARGAGEIEPFIVFCKKEEFVSVKAVADCVVPPSIVEVSKSCWCWSLLAASAIIALPWLSCELT
jgi:hypothetical protein